MEEELKEPTNEEIQANIEKLRKRLMPNPETLPVYVKDPHIVSGLKNYVSYSLTGSGVATSGLTRRYSEFYALRESLLRRWRGLYIPGIPPKQLTGNTDPVTMETRCRLLNSFLRRCAQLPYLSSSEEFKLFIGNTKDLAKTLDKMPKKEYGDVYLIYKRIFPKYYDNYDIVVGKGKMEDFQKFSRQLLHSISVFNNIIESGLALTKEGSDNRTKLVGIFKDYEKHVLREYAPPEKNLFSNADNKVIAEQVERFKEIENTFQDLHYWLEDDEMELEAMNQTINIYYDMIAEYDKLKKKREDIDMDIKNAQFGDSGIKSFFSFKSKEDIIKGLEEDKQKADQQIKVLFEVIKVSCFGLEYIMNDFKKEKMNNYFSYLKLYFNVQMRNTRTEENIWQKICEIDDVKAAFEEKKEEPSS